MDEQTTTAADPEVASGQDPQLENTEQATAEPLDSETQPDAGQDEQATQDYWANKGLDRNDPEFADKAAELARNAEREFHKGRQEASHLREQAEKSTTEADDITLQRLQLLETRQAIDDFYSTHPDARQLDEQMAATLKERPYLVQDFEALYAIVKTKNLDADIKAATDRAREQTKAEIAKASTASTPRGNATSSPSSSSEGTRDDQIRETFSNWD